jgi:hypothetical protein
MTAIPDSSPAIAPSVIAGLLLGARDHQLLLGLPSSGAEEIVEKTGAARSSAYEAKAKILEALPSLIRPAGRPPAPASPPPHAEALTGEVLGFVMDHPGCVHGGAAHRRYSDSFRRLVLDLHEKHPEQGVEGLAHAVEVPVDTLRDWLRTGAPPEPKPPETDPSAWATGNLHVQTVLVEWAAWEGGFVAFCEHVAEHLRVPYKRTAIAAILAAHGARQRGHREGRSPDEAALRESFETFFPGAQWVADGTPVSVTAFGQRFAFNFELVVDAHSGAFTGVSIRDEEDSAALLQAVADGKATTGAPPVAALVDNRPSNLTPEVHEALAADQTLLIPATKGRPQNKAHVEGAFGLFRQSVPPLVIEGDTEREVARELLRLLVTTWACTLNHRPRADRGGRSRVDLYSDKPTPDQVAQARAALAERLRRQEAARRTLQDRQDPIVRQTIAAAFARLGIADPGGHILDAISAYPLSPVVDGAAVFTGKQAAGSLPRDLEIPGRYLLGIVRNIAEQREGELISEAMLRARLEAQDALLAPLVQRRLHAEKETAAPSQTVACFVDSALDTDRHLDRLFWLSAAGDHIRAAAATLRPALFRLAARRINAASRVSYRDRASATRWLAHTALPLE